MLLGFSVELFFEHDAAPERSAASMTNSAVFCRNSFIVISSPSMMLALASKCLRRSLPPTLRLPLGNALNAHAPLLRYRAGCVARLSNREKSFFPTHNSAVSPQMPAAPVAPACRGKVRRDDETSRFLLTDRAAVVT